MGRLHRSRDHAIIIILCMILFSCSQTGLQSKKDSEESCLVPECERNYTKEGIWPFNRLQKTWVTYDSIDYQKGFDAAMMAIKTSGYRVVSSDQHSGTIHAEILPVAMDQETYPLEVKLINEKTSLSVHVSSAPVRGDSGKDRLCSFYREFEKWVKRSQALPATKQPPPSVKSPVEKPAEPEKSSSSPARLTTVEPPREATDPQPPEKTPPKTRVVWSLVNLREGPGTNYKIVDKVRKGTSLTVLDEKEGWLHVRLESGKEAWITKAATSEESKTGRASGPPPSRTSAPPTRLPSTPAAATTSPKPASPM